MKLMNSHGGLSGDFAATLLLRLGRKQLSLSASSALSSSLSFRALTLLSENN
jgi:hypothetical protein